MSINAMHAKPDLRVILEWTIAGSGSVIADVILLSHTPCSDTEPRHANTKTSSQFWRTISHPKCASDSRIRNHYLRALVLAANFSYVDSRRIAIQCSHFTDCN